MVLEDHLLHRNLRPQPKKKKRNTLWNNLPPPRKDTTQFLFRLVTQLLLGGLGESFPGARKPFRGRPVSARAFCGVLSLTCGCADSDTRSGARELMRLPGIGLEPGLEKFGVGNHIHKNQGFKSKCPFTRTKTSNPNPNRSPNHPTTGLPDLKPPQTPKTLLHVPPIRGSGRGCCPMEKGSTPQKLGRLEPKSSQTKPKSCSLDPELGPENMTSRWGLLDFGPWGGGAVREAPKT